MGFEFRFLTQDDLEQAFRLDQQAFISLHTNRARSAPRSPASIPDQLQNANSTPQPTLR